MQVHSELVGTSQNSSKELNQWPNMFLLHLAFFAGLDGAKNILAAKAAVHIIGLISESEDNEGDDEPQSQNSEYSEPSARTK